MVLQEKRPRISWVRLAALAASFAAMGSSFSCSPKFRSRLDKTPPRNVANDRFALVGFTSEISNVTTPQISGSEGEPRATALLWVNQSECPASQEISTTTVAGDGTFLWSGFTLSGDGSKIFFYRLRDRRGNQTPCLPLELSYELDTVAPAAPAVFNRILPAGIIGPGGSNQTAPQFSFSGAETQATVELFGNSTCTESLAAPFETASATSGTLTGTLSGDGVKQFFYRQTDAAGNPSPCTDSTQGYLLDTAPPTQASASWVLKDLSAVALNGLNASATSVTLDFTGAEVGGSSHLYQDSGCTNLLTQTSGLLASSGTLSLTTSVDGLKTFFFRYGDAAGNLGACTNTDQSYTLDNTPPSIVSLIRGGSTPTNASTLAFTVTFSEPVINVNTSRFTVRASGVTGASITGITPPTGPATTFTVTVNSGTGSGTLGIDFSDNDSVLDAVGLPFEGAGTQNYTDGETYLVDRTAPATSLNWTLSVADGAVSSQASPTLSFMDAEAGATLRVYSGFDGTNCTGLLTTQTSIAATGSFVPTLAGDGLKRFYYTLQDPSGNLSSCADTGRSYTLDLTPPTLTSVTRVQSSPSNATSLDFTVTFSEAVSNVQTTDFTLTASGVAGASITSVAGSGSTRTVTVATGTGSGTLRLDFSDANSVVDAGGNPFGGPGAQNTAGGATGTYTLDRTAPSTGLGWTLSSPADGALSSDATPSLNFTGAEAGVNLAVFSDSGCTQSLGTSNGIAASGSIALTLTGDGLRSFYYRLTDTAGNTSACTSTSRSYTLDTLAPSVASLVRVDANPTRAATAVFRVTFSETVTGVGVADFSLSPSLAGASVQSVNSVSGTVYDITVSTGSGDGSLGLQLTDDGSIVDGAANELGGVGTQNYTTGEQYTVDKTPPSTTLGWTLSSPGDGETSGDTTPQLDFSSAEAGGSLTVFSDVSCATSLSTLSSISTSGTFNLTTSGSGTKSFYFRIGDSLGNLSACTSTSRSYVLDQTGPSVSSINRDSAQNTAASSVTFTVTFSESVTGVDTGDFTITAATLTGTSVTSVTGSGSTRTVTVSTGTGSGSLRLDLADNNSIVDGFSNPLGGAGTQNYTGGQSYTLDRTAPAATLGWTLTSPTQGSTSSDTTPTLGYTGAEAGGSVELFSDASCTSSLGSFATASSSGSVTPTVSGDGSRAFHYKVLDELGNASACTNTSRSYTLDTTAPGVLSINRVGSTPSNASSLSFTVTFSEDVTGVGSSDFAIDASGVSGASITSVTGANGSYTVTVSTGTNDGTLGIRLNDDNSIVDAASNPLGGAGTQNYTAGQTYVMDRTSPPATLGWTLSSPNNGATSNDTTPSLAFTGAEAGGGVTLYSDGACTTALVSGSITELGGTSGSINPVINTTSGTKAFHYRVADALGNTSVCTNTTQSYTLDTTAPTVTSINRVDATPTNNAYVDFTVTFSETVTGVGSGDFSLNVTGGGSGYSIVSVSGSGTTYTVTVDLGTKANGAVYALHLIDDNSIVDGVGNVLGGAGTQNFTGGQTYTIDTSIVAPALVWGMSSPSSGTTSNDTTPVFTFSGATPGAAVQLYIGAGCATILGGALTADGTGAGTSLASTLTVSGGSGTKSFYYRVNGGACGNTSLSYTLDVTAPSVSSITRDSSETTNASSVSFTVTFSESVQTVAAGDFSLTSSGSIAGAAVSSVSGSGSTRTVTVNTGTGDGTIRLDLNDSNSSILDSPGNAISPTTFTGVSYTLDRTPPAVGLGWTLSSPADGSTSNDTTPQLGFTSATSGSTLRIYNGFDGVNCTGLENTQTGIANSGTINLTTAGSGSKAFYYTIADALGNTSACTNTGRSYTLDVTSPTLSSIQRAGGSATTSAASVDFTVTFSESVTGVDTSDFTLTTSGVSGAAVSSVTGSGATRTVSVSTGTGSGTIRLDLADNDSIADGSTNVLGGAGAQNFTSGQSYTIDRTAPDPAGLAWTLSSPSEGTTSLDTTPSFGYSSLQAGDIGGIIRIYEKVGATNCDTQVGILNPTVTASGTVAASVTGSGLKEFYFTVSDSYGNVSACTSTGKSYTVDVTAPSVSTITLNQTSPTNLASLSYTVTFSESVQTVVAGDFSLTQSGGHSGSSITGVTGSGTTWTVTVSTGSTSGSLQLNLADSNNSILDTVGNAISPNTFAGATYTIDKTAPPATLGWTLSSPADASTSSDTTPQLDFSSATAGSTLKIYSGISVGVCTGLLATQSSIGTTGTFNLSTSGSGAKGFYYTIADPLGNESSCTNTNRSYTLDVTGPSVSSIVRAASNPTSAASVTFTVTFAESVTGVDTADFSLSTSGVTGASITSVTGSGTTRTVTVGTGTGSGTIRLDLSDNDTIVDAYSNVFGGAGAQSYTSGESYTIDKTAPSTGSLTGTLSSPSDGSTSNDTTPNFSVSSIPAGDQGGILRIYEKVGGTNCSLEIATVNPVNVSNPSVNGSVSGNGLKEFFYTLSDAYGNTTACTTTGKSYTLDTTAPSLSSIARVEATTNNLSSVNFTVTFSESVGSVVAADFSLVATTTGASITSVTGSGTTRNVLVSTGTGNGTVRLDLNDANSSILDTAGNSLSATTATGQSYTIDKTAPSTGFSWTLSSPANGTTSADTSPDLTFGSPNPAESGATIKVFGAVGCGAGDQLSSQANIATSGTFNLTTSGSGSKVFYFTIQDPAGNVSACTNTAQSYTLDVTPPTVTHIKRIGSNPVNTGPFNFEVKFSESVTGVDSADFTVTSTSGTFSIGAITGSGNTYTVPVTIPLGTNVTSGTVRLDLTDNNTIKDGPGNTLGGAGTQNFTTGESFTVDVTPPTVTLGTKPTDPTYSRTAEFTFTSADTGGGTVSLTQCSLDGAAYTTCTSPYSLSGLLSGNHTLEVRAVDTAGNTGVDASHTWMTVPGTVTQFAVGTDFSCAVVNGGVRCWGRNDKGQLGDGTTINRTTPTLIPGLAEGVTAIAASGTTSERFACVIRKGAVDCWGSNTYGQLGDGTTTPRSSPTTVSGLNHGVSAITLGPYHACAIQNGAAKCWGYNNSGRLGDDTTTNRLTPANVSAMTWGVQQIAASDSGTCAVEMGALYCWGSGLNGRIGDGTTSTRYTPVAVSGIPAGAKLSSQSRGGEDHQCAIQDGVAKCWGLNTTHQLGDGTTTQRLTPVSVTNGPPGAKEIVVAGNSTCILGTDGAIECVGENADGQLGDGTLTNKTTPGLASSMVSGVSQIGLTAFSTLDAHSGALKNGKLHMWGANTYSQIGDQTTTRRLAAVEVPELEVGVMDIFAGAYSDTACALVGGGLKCWGWNFNSQLLDGTTTNRSSAVVNNSYSVELGNVTSASQAYTHACVVRNGSVRCWGEGVSGQLGNGSTASTTAPVTVSAMSGTAESVSIGYRFSCALSLGDVRCWGLNTSGQLGNGTTTNSSTPVVAIGSHARKVSAGFNHACAIVNGHLRCWGDGDFGKIGNGFASPASSPQYVKANPSDILQGGVSDVSVGYDHSCAIIDGVVYCWGDNTYKQLGDGSTTMSSNSYARPVQDWVPLLYNPITFSWTYGYAAFKAQKITAGRYHTCALNNGSVSCWGRNNQGQLGDGTLTNRDDPTPVSGLPSHIESIAAGAYFTCALGRGRVYCWGAATGTGDGANTQRTTPVTVKGL
jgi:alpha-tubulin suppressor-like RCC1 family protein